MKKLIRINLTPNEPDFEVVGDKIIQLTVPYSNKSVTIKVSPQILDYKENNDQDELKVRNISITSDSLETILLKFDYEHNKTKELEINEKIHTITLMNIGLEKFDKQDFLYFEFFVEEVE